MKFVEPTLEELEEDYGFWVPEREGVHVWADAEFNIGGKSLRTIVNKLLDEEELYRRFESRLMLYLAIISLSGCKGFWEKKALAYAYHMVVANASLVILSYPEDDKERVEMHMIVWDSGGYGLGIVGYAKDGVTAEKLMDELAAGVPNGFGELIEEWEYNYD